jgi:diguanylate cyclase (GGDEF)-like protein
MLVVDAEDRIVDSNLAAQKILGRAGQTLLRQPVQAFFPLWAGWLEDASSHAARVFATQFGERHFDVKISVFWDAANRMSAKLVILHDVTEYLLLLSKVHKYAITDPLLDMFNRRHFKDLAEQALKTAQRQQEPMSLILFDIDRFKEINDAYGHRVGDEVLKALGSHCQQFIRSQDILARYGGEEFVILLPQVNSSQAYRIGDRLRREICDLTIPTQAGPISIAISIGVATIEPGMVMPLENLVERADQALYRAKQCGRNQVSVWGMM